MAGYFIVDTYIDEKQDTKDYDYYINEVKPIVENYGGKYLARTQNIKCLSEKRNPQRVIIIEFDSRKSLEKCFSSHEYRLIANKRENTVDARAVIVEDN